MRERVYFHAGELVELKQDLPNKPTMMIVRIVKSRIKVLEEEGTDKKSNIFIGVKCCWFTKDSLYQEQIFSSKDLSKV